MEYANNLYLYYYCLLVLMWADRSQLMFRTSSQFGNSNFRLNNYSSQMTHRQLKQVFNITYTHYCSTSVHKKLQIKCKQAPKRYYKVGGKDTQDNYFMASQTKRELLGASPLKLKFISLRTQQSKRSKYDPKHKKIQIKIRRAFRDRLEPSQIYSEQQFPLKALGHKVELQQKSDQKRQQRRSLYRPSTAHPCSLKSREVDRATRLKTTCQKRAEDKQSWSEIRSGVKGWQLTQRQY